MKNVILILSISLVLIISIYFIKILQNDNIDNFQEQEYDNPHIIPDNYRNETQLKTSYNIDSAGKQTAENKANIDEIGDKVERTYSNIYKIKERTKEVLDEKKDKIIQSIMELDVLKDYHTLTNTEETQRWIDPKYENKKCKSEELDLRGGAQCNDKDPNKAQKKCIQICAHHCNLNDNCISFNYQKSTQTCKLSSLCSLKNLDTTNPNDNDFDLYFKTEADANSPITKYNLHKNKKCTNDKVSLNRGERKSLNDCAQSCIDNSKCISFDYNKNNRICRLSKECYDQNAQDSNNHNLYVKKSLLIHPYNLTIYRPPTKKFIIELNYLSPNRFGIDKSGNKAILSLIANNKDKDSQIFELITTCNPCNHNNYNEGFLRNLENKYLYFKLVNNNIEENITLSLGNLPDDANNKLNYQWIMKPNGNIVSKFKRTVNNKVTEYALNHKFIINTHWKKHSGGSFDREKGGKIPFSMNNSNKDIILKKYDANSTKWRRNYI